MQEELIPAPRSRVLAHICKNELERYEAALKAGSNKVKPPRPKTVFIAPGIDPRWLVGQCSRCHEIITEKNK